MQTKITEFYVFICESSKYFGTEVRVYEKEENAKKAVASVYEEYIIDKNYKPQDEMSFIEAEEDYKDRDKTGFIVMLNDNEKFECRYEKAIFADILYHKETKSLQTKK